MGDMGWAVHWSCHGRQTVCDPPSVSPVLSHCIPRIAEYLPSKAAKSTSKGRACSALAVHAGEPNTAPFQFYCVAHFTHAASPTSVLASVPWSPSSQSGAPTADKGPSTEMEALTAAHQGMLHAVSLHRSAPHSVAGLEGLQCSCMGVMLILLCVCVCVFMCVCLCVHVLLPLCTCE